MDRKVAVGMSLGGAIATLSGWGIDVWLLEPNGIDPPTGVVAAWGVFWNTVVAWATPK